MDMACFLVVLVLHQTVNVRTQTCALGLVLSYCFSRNVNEAATVNVDTLTSYCSIGRFSVECDLGGTLVGPACGCSSRDNYAHPQLNCSVRPMALG